MPLSMKGEEIQNVMEKEYGKKKGEQVFYASKNKGKISGVDAKGRWGGRASDKAGDRDCMSEDNSEEADGYQ